jgi:nucleoside 2-deoxyribosyltransferase
MGFAISSLESSLEAVLSRKVFVSYAARDRSLLSSALDQLRANHVLSSEDDIVVDNKKELEGEDIRQATRAAIDAADTVLVLWSPAAAESKWVNYELGMASALGKRLVVVTPQGKQTEVPIASNSFELVEMNEP